MRRALLFITTLVLLIVIVVAASSVRVDVPSDIPPADASDNSTFYVGVTYCGDNVVDAKVLIDKVKSYTNLFILQSGQLQHNHLAIDEIGDYAVNAGLNFIVYFGVNSISMLQNWLPTYDGHWGNHFLGIYIDDEPGGKMLDGKTILAVQSDQSKMISSITKTSDGTISGYHMDPETVVTYMQNGTVITETYGNKTLTTYCPDGSVTAQYENGTQINLLDASHLKFTYDQLWLAYPFQTYQQAADVFVNQTSVRGHFNRFLGINFTMFTSDYALQWFDYKGGYDVVLTELGWNHSVTQNIALVRGAANVFGKEWGAMITWKYLQAPYLPSGNEMYQQMCTAYENGAKYIAIFNYAEDMQGPYGTLTDEHFQALQLFWKDEVNNPNATREQVKADTAFVLPKDFGSGLRNKDDIIWGLWWPTPENQTVVLHLQDAFAKYGGKLDIVYDDPAYPAAGKYPQLYYWNHTG